MTDTVDTAVKAGARHSRADVNRLKKVKANASEIVEAAIELGADADEIAEAVEEGADAANKALSLSEREQRVYAAFGAAYSHHDEVMPSYAKMPWLMEVYDTYAIVRVW